MTVAEIKEYIDNAIETAFAQKIAIDTAEILKKALIDTKYMLDELEPSIVFKEVKEAETDTKHVYKVEKKDNLTKWIRDTSHGMIRFQCDNCKGYKTLAYNFCPDCGDKMDVIKLKKMNGDKNEQ